MWNGSFCLIKQDPYGQNCDFLFFFILLHDGMNNFHILISRNFFQIVVFFAGGLFSSMRNDFSERSSKGHLPLHLDVLQCNFLLLKLCKRGIRT